MRSSSRLAARAKVLQIWMDQKVHKKKESKSTLFAVRGVSLRGECILGRSIASGHWATLGAILSGAFLSSS